MLNDGFPYSLGEGDEIKTGTRRAKTEKVSLEKVTLRVCFITRQRSCPNLIVMARSAITCKPHPSLPLLMCIFCFQTNLDGDDSSTIYPDFSCVLSISVPLYLVVGLMLKCNIFSSFPSYWFFIDFILSISISQLMLQLKETGFSGVPS